MTRKRTAASFAIATVAGSALSLTLAPIANADPNLQPIISAVQGDRGNTPCGQFAYNGDLEAAAQAYARSENTGDIQQFGNYRGTRLGFLGSGDPQAAAINSAYTRGAGGAISNCDLKDFGVGFIRHEDRSVDVVTIVFGTPAPPQDAPKPATHPCPPGGDMPANIPCPEAPPAPAQNTATVLQNDDVYNKPDGNGKAYKDADGVNIFVPPGQVQLATNPARCDDWCHITTNLVPGDAWIYSATDFVTKP